MDLSGTAFLSCFLDVLLLHVRVDRIVAGTSLVWEGVSYPLFCMPNGRVLLCAMEALPQLVTQEAME